MKHHTGSTRGRVVNARALPGGCFLARAVFARTLLARAATTRRSERSPAARRAGRACGAQPMSSAAQRRAIAPARGSSSRRRSWSARAKSGALGWPRTTRGRQALLGTAAIYHLALCGGGGGTGRDATTASAARLGDGGEGSACVEWIVACVAPRAHLMKRRHETAVLSESRHTG